MGVLMAGKFRVAQNVAAIWLDGAGDAPFSAPLDHLDLLKFHSTLRYPKVVRTEEMTLSLPSVSGVAQRVAAYSLFAHGVGGVPWILGAAVIQNQLTAFTGSVCVQQEDGSSSHGYGRFLALGADEAFVWVHEYAVLTGTGAASSYPALDVSLTVLVTDRVLV